MEGRKLGVADGNDVGNDEGCMLWAGVTLGMIDGLSLRCKVGALLQEGNKLGAGIVEVEGAKEWWASEGRELGTTYGEMEGVTLLVVKG